jgi:hypothetical protein
VGYIPNAYLLWNAEKKLVLTRDVKLLKKAAQRNTKRDNRNKLRCSRRHRKWGEEEVEISD